MGLGPETRSIPPKRLVRTLVPPEISDPKGLSPGDRGGDGTEWTFGIVLSVGKPSSGPDALLSTVPVPSEGH